MYLNIISYYISAKTFFMAKVISHKAELLTMQHAQTNF